MSDIVERTLVELLNTSIEKVNFDSDANLNRLKKATQTLYTISLSKIPKLRPEEDVARCHIAGLIALEKLATKYPELKVTYHVDKIPLNPRNVLKLKNLFKDILLNSSPVKNQLETNGIKWFSPNKKQVQHVQSQDSNRNMMRMSPEKLSKHLFPFLDSSPTKETASSSPQAIKSERKLMGHQTEPLSSESELEPTPSPLKSRVRRKLAFELEDVTSSPFEKTSVEPQRNDGSPRRRRSARTNHNNATGNNEDIIDFVTTQTKSKKQKTANGKQNSDSSPAEVTDVLEEAANGRQNTLDETSGPKERSLSAKTRNRSVKRREESPLNGKNDASSTSATRAGPLSAENSAGVGLFYLKFRRLQPERIIEICNMFEIPSNRAVEIMNFYYVNSHYLTSSYRLLCGLILNCCKYIFLKEREQNPSLDFLLIDRMKSVMECDSEKDIFISMEIVNELLDGDSWFKKMKSDYISTSRGEFLEKLLIRRGSMLQVNQSYGTSSTSETAVSTEFFKSWREKIMVDLHLKHGNDV